MSLNDNTYRVLIVPAAQFITESMAEALAEMKEVGFPVLFIEEIPEALCNGRTGKAVKSFKNTLKGVQPTEPGEITTALEKLAIRSLLKAPRSSWLRTLQYRYHSGGEMLLVVNEGAEDWAGVLQIPTDKPFRLYDAWENRLFPPAPDAVTYPSGSICEYRCTVRPLHSLILLFDEEIIDQAFPVFEETTALYRPDSDFDSISLNSGWIRSTCWGIDYPDFSGHKTIELPDRLADEQKRFSGYVRYEKTVTIPVAKKVILEIEDAHEGFELFINGTSLGIQIAPPYRFDITAALKPGENRIIIEVRQHSNARLDGKT